MICRWRMWYSPWDGAYAVAHSVDGIHWHRPGLGLVTNTSIYSRWVRKGGELRTIGNQSNLIPIGLGRYGSSVGWR